jgi:hypothetical protein
MASARNNRTEKFWALAHCRSKIVSQASEFIERHFWPIPAGQKQYPIRPEADVPARQEYLLTGFPALCGRWTTQHVELFDRLSGVTMVTPIGVPEHVYDITEAS